ncbi:hypothetical protein [Vitreimonas flagellata]|uniref:hypothetical protein n=1 Tax=Vitreimonas flagellata TaxID=2560861 RepID=UPI0010750CC5|nr:hypothetical protein [Vitreimonas flagellata]
MHILAILLMQAVLAEPIAPPTAPAEPAAAEAPADATAPAAETTNDAPQYRCERRAPTGQRLARRICTPIDDEREEATRDTVRNFGTRTSSGAGMLGGN